MEESNPKLYKVDEKLLEENLAKLTEKKIKARVLILGSTGVGKSSIIQKVFPFLSPPKIAYGTPTTEWNDIEHEWFDPNGEKPIILHDSKGFELGDFDFKSKFGEWIKKRFSGGIEEQIHVVWYCISLSNGRFQEEEKSVINGILRSVPVIIILTMRDLVKKEKENKMKEILEKCEFQNVKGIVVTRMEIPSILENCPKCDCDDEKDITYSWKSGRWECRKCDSKGTLKEEDGIANLVECTYDSFTDNAVRYAFAQSQTYSMAVRALGATGIIVTATGLAAAIGANPIPFSDAFLLIPVQTAMIIAIGKIFETVLTIKRLLKLGLSQLILTFVGTSIASSLKLIPGAGSVVEATVASSLTAAFGILYTVAFAIAWEKGWTKLSDEELFTKLKQHVTFQKLKDLFLKIKNNWKFGEERELLEKIIKEEGKPFES